MSTHPLCHQLLQPLYPHRGKFLLSSLNSYLKGFLINSRGGAMYLHSHPSILSCALGTIHCFGRESPQFLWHIAAFPWCKCVTQKYHEVESETALNLAFTGLSNNISNSIYLSFTKYLAGLGGRLNSYRSGNKSG